MRRGKVLYALLLLTVTHVFVMLGQSCPEKPDLGTKVRRYTGHYMNGAYGFATNLPTGLVGLDTDDPDHQRGFVIELPGEKGWIWVYADTNSLDDGSLLKATETDVAALRKRALRVDTPLYEKGRLSGRPAQRVTTKFECKGSAQSFGFEAVEVTDRSGRFTYNLTWEGPTSGSAMAKRTLQSLEHSWRFIPAR